MDDNNKDRILGYCIVFILVVFIAILLAFCHDDEPVPEVETVYITVIVTATPTPTEPVIQNFYTSTPSPSPSPTPSPTPTCTPTVAPTPTKAPKAVSHSYKPWTSYTVYNIVSSPNYRLQQIAKTDIYGLRVVTDSAGEERWIVAMGQAWTGPHATGRCFDIYMENGARLPVVIGDVKKWEHSLNGEGKYGRKGDLLEFIVDLNALVPMAKTMGDASYCADIFKGEAKEVIARDDVNIPGLD